MTWVVTAHQANFLPGASVLTKIAAADAIIWEDELEFTRGYEHRNRLPNGKWVTVPVEYGSVGEPLNRVRISREAEGGKGWRKPMTSQIRRAWPGPVTELVCEQIESNYRSLLGLNVSLLAILLPELRIRARQHFQSHLESGHAWPGSAFNSERLAAMVEEVGGTVYLSGPSGRKYLDETPFEERGIEIRYWEHDGRNPCALELVEQAAEVAA